MAWEQDRQHAIRSDLKCSDCENKEWKLLKWFLPACKAGFTIARIGSE